MEYGSLFSYIKLKKDQNEKTDSSQFRNMISQLSIYGLYLKWKG